MNRSAFRRASALANLRAFLIAPLAPVRAQVGTEEECERAEACERRIERSMPARQYEVYKFGPCRRST